MSTYREKAEELYIHHERAKEIMTNLLLDSDLGYVNLPEINYKIIDNFLKGIDDSNSSDT